jgi:predicted heme/steroid binding protein
MKYPLVTYKKGAAFLESQWKTAKRNHEMEVKSVSKTFTLAELKEYNGKNGKPAYVAFEGKVYDVTNGFTWGDGEHLGQHEAGMDLTKGMDGAPHGDEILADVPVVGTLVG